MMTGKGSINHNSRKFHAENTVPERSHLNVVAVKTLKTYITNYLMKLLNDIMQNRKEKIDVSMIIMKRYVPENRKNYFMKLFCRLEIKMIVLRIPTMGNWQRRYWTNI